ncbi:PP2C family protein-serine/threonine phosphatase [Geothrix sp. 21YS21S-4]|uniref:PP2C family protein-serine/threonine phosphatase n=1 Tax=Geothrix sp. 21YS21S-4 TaxID=3068889 RepID=UPI0027BAF26A|nr:PP2C family protein-serine/threonine phosphatase [Geothrix sp. 21YS21S-4]
MPTTTPFDRLRQLALKTPEGAQELLPLIDFLETFPEQGTEEDLVHLVGVTAMGIAKARQGGLWDGGRWLFLRGSAPPFPTHPGEGWQVLPWRYGDETYGHLVLKATDLPAAVPLLLSISAPLLAWRRAEAVRSSQNQALALQLSRLNTVFELTRNLGQVETRQDLVRLMANTLMGEFRIMRLLVVDPQGGILHAKGLGRVPEALEGDALHELVETKGLVHAIELQDQNHSHGFAYVADPVVGSLSEDDEVFLHTLLNLTSSQLSSLELREARLQADRMEKDLDLARNIQRSLLPQTLPEPAGWQCAAANLPYQAVGGDLYDLWMARDDQQGDRLHMAVGDISGKGLPASMMMTQLSAFLRAMGDRRVDDWGRLAERLNRRMNSVRDGNRYTTLFAASLNPENGDLRYVNGGHNPPLLVRAGGEVVRLAPTGPMVGLLPGVKFAEGRASMGLGDTLVIFTDGLVEAENAAGEELSDGPLGDVVRRLASAGADDLFEALLVAAFQHLEEGRFRDDVTLVVVKRMGA